MEVDTSQLAPKPLGVLARILISLLTILTIYTIVFTLFSINKNKTVIFSGWSDFHRKIFQYPEFPEVMGCIPYYVDSQYSNPQFSQISKIADRKKVYYFSGRYCLVNVGSKNLSGGELGYADFHYRGSGEHDSSTILDRLICPELFGGTFDENNAPIQQHRFPKITLLQIANSLHTPVIGYYSSIFFCWCAFVVMGWLAKKRNSSDFELLARTGKWTLLVMIVLGGLTSMILYGISNINIGAL